MTNDAIPSEGDRHRPEETKMTENTRPWIEGGTVGDFEEDGEITNFADEKDTVIIKTPSRTWEGSPDEFLEMREALNEVDFNDGSE